jgi:NAD(P)-dependent dehydrogenase (short-subunit alcohol dehydrogenase family)
LIFGTKERKLAVNFFDLTGKVALVTGSSKGLGNIMARALVKAGADIVITSRSLEPLVPVQKEFESYGAKVFPVILDVEKQDSILDAVKKAEDHFGKIDILVNNAGVNKRKFAVDYTWEEWDWILNTNLKGSFFMAREVAKGMLKRNYGRIINIGSGTALFGYKTVAPYSAGRGGVKQMTMCLAGEWAEHNITVNCICPGWFLTDISRKQFEDKSWSGHLLERLPAKRFGTPTDLDTAVIFFASEASCYVNGQTICVDGGFSTGDCPAPSSVAPPSIG